MADDEDDAINAMSVKKLRAHISAAGLCFTDCIEKSDLRQRAREASAAAPAPATTTAMKLVESVRTMAGYSCVLNSPGEGAIDLVVIVLHGYGASNDNFSPLPSLFAGMPNSPLRGKRIAWIFPQAKADKAGVPAWWDIDVMEWMSSMQGGTAALARLIRKEFGGLPECRASMAQLLSEVDLLFQGHGGGPAPLCFGGFSQGAMTAMDAALSLPVGRVKGVIMLSGAPITVDKWAPLLQARRGEMRVLVTHGRSDPVLPFAGSSWLNELLVNGLGSEAVTYEAHGGGHELGGKEGEIVKFLGALLV